MLNIFISYMILLHLILKKKKKVGKNKNKKKFSTKNKLTSFASLALTATTNDKSRQRAPPTTSMTSSNSIDNQAMRSFDASRSDDIRCFHCPDTKWKLQPTIKLLTAYGNEVEPFGADYILQKLGFRHARLTIPKWLQRGIMDPCEQSMTFVQLFLLFLLPERFKEMCMRK